MGNKCSAYLPSWYASGGAEAARHIPEGKGARVARTRLAWRALFCKASGTLACWCAQRAHMIAPGKVPAAPAMPQVHQLGTPAAAQMRRYKNHGGKGARVVRTRRFGAPHRSSLPSSASTCKWHWDYVYYLGCNKYVDQ